MIKEITAKYDAEKIEKKVTQFWEESDAYLRTRERRKTGKKFFLLTAPHTLPDTFIWGQPGTRSSKIPFFAITP